MHLKVAFFEPHASEELEVERGDRRQSSKYICEPDNEGAGRKDGDWENNEVGILARWLIGYV